MKTIAVLLACLLSSLFLQAQEGDQKGVTITVTINNALNDNGQVILSLHTEETFMKGLGIQNAKKEIKDGKVAVTFTDVPKGIYAIIALHDENANNRMDFELNGMPKEAYGASGNDMSYGPPTFTAAKFSVEEEDINMTIRL